ncbi:MAG TPA: DUF4124 domain-containing protein [Oleiagrimonas sp.]|nr:DUF4124 domain-containing protein [Oleiagrimonas sp.]
MQRLPAFVLLTTLLCIPLAVSAQVYKWTDAHGTVHYADTPPKHGTRYKGVNIPGATRMPSKPADTRQPAAGNDATDPENTPSTATASKRMPDTPANRRKLCDNLTVNMKLLKKNGPVVMQDKNGKNQLLSKQDRAGELAREQQKYQTYCTE